jgi:hypothetical protein
MKSIVAVSILSLGLATGAFARAPDDLLPALASAAPVPVTAPDWNLPSPCNLGAWELLASNADRLVWSPTGEAAEGAQLVDYKCASSEPVRPSLDPSPLSPFGGK